MVNSSQFQSNDSDIVASANASYQKVSNQKSQIAKVMGPT